MTLQVTITSDTTLPAGKPVRVEVRDTSVADAAAIVVTSQTARVPPSGEPLVVTLQLDRVESGYTIWAHVDTDSNGRVSKGDLITMESYPVARSGEQTTVRVRSVN